MKNRLIQFGLCLSAIAGVMQLTANTAHSQGGGVKNVIWLQGATPGVSQSGHGNISGTFRAGNFIGNGSGLTGVTASGLTLPFSGSFTPGLGSGAFSVTNPGAGAAILGIHGAPSGTPTLSAAILGRSDTDLGVWGTSVSSVGVRGQSESGTGIFARTSSGPYALEAHNFASNSIGMFGHTNGTNGTGVLGEANGTGVEGHSLGTGGTGVGVRGTAVDSDGFGVEGLATATTGFNVGVKGESASTTGQGVFGRATNTTSANIGVYGWASGTSGKGVYGLADSPTGNTVGVHGISSSSTGYGLFGAASSLTGVTYGVYGISSSPSGYGVMGISGASTGNAGGVRGLTSSPTGRAVEGNALSTGVGAAYGGFFSSASTGGFGVRGEATDNTTTINYGGYFLSSGTGQAYGAYCLTDGVTGRGVYGFAGDGTAIAYGARGQAAAPGFGIYAVGDYGGSGAKSFVIDHPSDPANKYLRHYCSEGPVPYNVYAGKTMTDSSGYAWVELPSYFSDINKDPLVQLTVVDSSDDFVMAKVVSEVEDGRFRIRTSKGNVRVNWEVKAERNDMYMRANPPRQEYDKEGPERGKYQHPELYGMPESMGMDYNPKRKSNATISEAARRRLGY